MQPARGGDLRARAFAPPGPCSTVLMAGFLLVPRMDSAYCRCHGPSRTPDEASGRAATTLLQRTRSYMLPSGHRSPSARSVLPRSSPARHVTREAAFPHVEVDPRQATRIYADNWRENWTVFRSLLDLAASHAEAKELKTEFTTLSDIYHALGASRLAVPVGWLIGVIYAVAGYTPRVLDHLLRVIFAAALMLVVCTFVFWVLHRARRATWRSALACAHYGLTWCFATHPEFMQLDGREYPYTPRKDLRQSHDGDAAPTPRGRRRPWRRTRPPRRIP